MIYIHYYFADFAKKNSVEIFSDAKTTSYFSQKMNQYKKDFSVIRRNMVKGASSTQEAEKLIDAIEQNAVLSEERASYFKENYNADIASAKSMREAAAIAETLAQEVQLFLEQLQNTIQEIAANLNLNLEAIKEDIVSQYCSARNVMAGSSNFRQKVLQDFLTHEGIKKLGISGGGTGQKALDSSIRNMILLAEALPEYGTSGGSALSGMRYSTGATAKKGKSYEVSKDGSQTLDIIQRKLQGLLNNVIGTGAEIAWAQAEKIGKREVAGRILTANAEVSGGSMVTIKNDDQLIEDSQKSTAIRVSKPDVRVTLADKEVVVDYGVSVKQYKFNSQTGVQSVSIVSNTSLLEALEKYGKQNLYSIYNLAGGHADKNAGYSSDSLNNM